MHRIASRGKNEVGTLAVDVWTVTFLAVPNVTAQPSMASVPITVFLYNFPLLFGLMWFLPRDAIRQKTTGL